MLWRRRQAERPLLLCHISHAVAARRWQLRCPKPGRAGRPEPAPVESAQYSVPGDRLAHARNAYSRGGAATLRSKGLFTGGQERASCAGKRAHSAQCLLPPSTPARILDRDGVHQHGASGARRQFVVCLAWQADTCLAAPRHTSPAPHDRTIRALAHSGQSSCPQPPANAHGLAFCSPLSAELRAEDKQRGERALSA